MFDNLWGITLLNAPGSTANKLIPPPQLRKVCRGGTCRVDGYAALKPRRMGGGACIACTIELFDAKRDAVGDAEGAKFRGVAKTNAAGNFSFPVTIGKGRFCATTTDHGNNTSEFSDEIRVP
jgi:hypothetical protein